MADVSQRIKKPGVVEVVCDSGQFRIDEIPRARYRVTAWHEGWVVTGKDKDGRPVYDPPRVLTRDVTVPAKGEVAVEFELK